MGFNRTAILGLLGKRVRAWRDMCPRLGMVWDTGRGAWTERGGSHTPHLGPGFPMVPVLGSLQAGAGALFWKQRDHVLGNES